jgi:nitrite reductase (NADH) large subunit
VLGVEAAEALSHLGLPVTILVRGPRLMERQLDTVGGRILAEYLSAKRIEVVLNCAIAGYDGTETIRAVRLADGREIAADIFVACAGIKPNVELARKAGLAVGTGIKVDQSMQTSDPHVFAVGDVAEPPEGAGGLWPIAVTQSRIAADTMLGRTRATAPAQIILRLKSDGIDVHSFGALEGDASSEIFTARAGSAAWWRVIVRDDQITGAVYVGPPRSSNAFLKVLKATDKTVAPAIRSSLAAGSLENLEAAL